MPNKANGETEAETASETPLVNVLGKQVALGPLSRPLAPRYRAWMNDFATQGSAGYPERPAPWTDEQIGAWYEQAAHDHERLWFTIYETETWRAIGMCILRDIDHLHRTAEFGITIGDSIDRGKGYGTEAVRLLLDVAFVGLGLNNMQLVVYEFNRAGQRAYEKAGFKKIGHRRKAHFMGGQFWDVIYMDCLAEDFESPVLSRMLTLGQTHRT